MEISRFPCKRLPRMRGSTTTRGRHVSCDIDICRVAFCRTENISTPDLSYAAQYLACAPSAALADNPCITRGQCGSLLLHRDGLPPSIFCRSPGAPAHMARSEPQRRNCNHNRDSRNPTPNSSMIPFDDRVCLGDYAKMSGWDGVFGFDRLRREGFSQRIIDAFQSHTKPPVSLFSQGPHTK
jgi:hypothetical protein